MCSSVTGEKEGLVLYAEGDDHFFTQKNFMGILNGNLF